MFLFYPASFAPLIIRSSPGWRTSPVPVVLTGPITLLVLKWNIGSPRRPLGGSRPHRESCRHSFGIMRVHTVHLHYACPPPIISSTTYSAMARLDVKPGLSIPSKLISSPSPCPFAWSRRKTKSWKPAPGPTIFGLIPQ